MKFAARSKSNQLAPTKARSAGGKSRRTSPLVREPAGFVGSAPRLGASPPSYAPGIQTKLKVGKPNDRFEQEADRVAEQVVRTDPPDRPRVDDGGRREGRQPPTMPLVRHRLTHADGGGEAPPLVRAALRSPGRPLDASTRSFMETRFGHDFGHVRVHTDPLAAESARSVKALAYAVGHHMIFAQGSYAPASQAGRKIIAHELVHQLQQGASAGTHLQRFTESLEGWVGGFDDDSAMEVNLRYKVFDSTGQAIFNSEFTGPNDRPSVTLNPGNSYVIQIIGRVSVLRDVTGLNEHNHWTIRIDWPVTVDQRGRIAIRPAVPNVAGGTGDAPWSLAYGDVRDQESSTVGLTLSLSSTESTTTTYTGTLGLSESGEVTVEGSLEPAGVGGAASGTAGGGLTQEVSRGVEFSRGSTLTRKFGLLLDLRSTPPPPTLEVGPSRTAVERVVEFRSGQADFSGSQRDELVRSFLALDPDPDPFRQRGEGLRILIEGYASNLGEPDFNRDLSQRRAEFVAEIARATLPGADIPAPGFLGEAPWTHLPDTDDQQAHRVATVRVIDNRAALE